ncbi:MAG: 2Fe-2S iron-sulfur cluster binding domain-containing protein, partial [Syntrophobacteraceae bacterium]
MPKHKIRFLPHDKEILVPDEQTIIQSAIEAGVHINASCGGAGQCGKCRVIIEEGVVDGGTSERLDPEDFAKGYRLACRAHVKADLTVRIPVESDIDSRILNRRATARRSARIQQLRVDDLKSKGLFIPPIQKMYIELPEPS